MLTDSYGRRIDYLRISVTDRCDLRCTYCLPQGFKGFSVPKNWLTLQETARIAAAFARLGSKRFRLTGGEPLLRKGLSELAAEIARQPGVEDLSLTTNGTQLAKHAATLKQAGVSRLNISLDSLDRERVRQISGSDSLPKVLDGIRAARQAGFTRIKINTVLLGGINDRDIGRMAAFCREHGLILNLIEAMPVGDTGRRHAHTDIRQTFAALQQQYGLSPLQDTLGGGPARYWQSDDGLLTLGLITPMSRHFCADCNRVRLSVTGRLHLCLGQEDQVPLLPLLRDGCSDSELEQAIRQAVMRKPEKHEFVEQPHKIIRIMAQTGG